MNLRFQESQRLYSKTTAPVLPKESLKIRGSIKKPTLICVFPIYSINLIMENLSPYHQLIIILIMYLYSLQRKREFSLSELFKVYLQMGYIHKTKINGIIIYF